MNTLSWHHRHLQDRVFNGTIFSWKDGKQVNGNQRKRFWLTHLQDICKMYRNAEVLEYRLQNANTILIELKGELKLAQKNASQGQKGQGKKGSGRVGRKPGKAARKGPAAEPAAANSRDPVSTTDLLTKNGHAPGAVNPLPVPLLARSS